MLLHILNDMILLCSIIGCFDKKTHRSLNSRPKKEAMRESNVRNDRTCT